MLEKWQKQTDKALARFRQKEYARFIRRRRQRLENTGFSIIASNCSGTFMYKDLGLQYLSPTIALTIPMKDFVKMCGDLRYYMAQELVPAGFPFDCPVGFLGDVRVNFVHYESFQQAAAKWNQRAQRINWDNLFLIGTDQNGCTEETIRRFEQLPCSSKVLFTHVPRPEFSCTYYLKGFEDREELGDFTAPKNQLLRRRHMDQFDYVKFLNQGGSRYVSTENY